MPSICLGVLTTVMAAKAAAGAEAAAKAGEVKVARNEVRAETAAVIADWRRRGRNCAARKRNSETRCVAAEVPLDAALTVRVHMAV